MWELDYEESWVPKNCCFWTGVLEKTLESPLDCKEIQPVNPKGDQSWVFIGRMDIEAETPIFWPPDVKSWLIGKDRDAGRDWGQEETGTTEDEMVGWHHWLNGHGFGWTPGVGDRQGGLACCSSWGHKELDMTEWLNWTGLTELSWMECYFLVSCLLPLLPTDVITSILAAILWIIIAATCQEWQNRKTDILSFQYSCSWKQYITYSSICVPACPTVHIIVVFKTE